MTRSISPPTRFAGTVTLPADKSIAHRAAIFASIADGPSTIHGFPASKDPQSTLSCLKQLGVPIEISAQNTVHITGVGRHGLRQPNAPLDCGNSGTTMRLLAGVLSGQPFESELVGDPSLTSRPMQRIAQPLQNMGARISLTDGHAPIKIHPSENLRAVNYQLPVASAQVKSCVLLAGLWARGRTTVRETVPSRDHTERMLNLPVVHSDHGRSIYTDASHPIPCGTFTLPGDFSAAAFILVATSIVGTGPVCLPRVGLNPSRTGLLTVLKQMGANIQITEQVTDQVEPIGTLTVQRASLRGIRIEKQQIPNIIDEIPVIAVAGIFAAGATSIRDATELRYKECDRIHAIVTNLRKLGADIEEFQDGCTITGMTPLSGSIVSSYDDHRIAMAMGIAGLGAQGTTTIQNAQAVSVSFPEFWETIAILQT